MIKLFIGSKGSGKTKTLIELTNNAAQNSNGSVVCIEKGDKLKHEIRYSSTQLSPCLPNLGYRYP